jgi:ATP-dependent protease ClpP protease subunit
MKPRHWYRFENQASDPSVAEIYIIDIIGDWIDELINEYYGMKATITAKAFIDQISKLDASVTTIRVHINSPGGDVFAAANIANVLRDQQVTKGRTVETVIDGLAASAASVIAMAGSTVTISDNGLLMIHQPWTGLYGNAAELRKAADELDTVTKTITATYRWHTEMSHEDIVALMDATTWMTADEAIEKGFATAKVEGLPVAASIDHRAVATLKVPERFKDRVKSFVQTEPTPEPAPTPAAALDIVRACNEAGTPDLAEGQIASGSTLEAAKVSIGAEKVKRSSAAAREKDIRALCASAKVPQLADGLVAGGMSIESVRAHVVNVTALIDAERVVDPTLTPSNQHLGKARKLATTAEIYAARANGK